MSHYDLEASLLKFPRHRAPSSSLNITALPLNLLAHIISYKIDDVADLARICRTSRILHYMTQPQLYKNITLTAYHDIRYKDELPEGFGNASPFSMGLNALVTRKVSTLVNSLTLQGEWREHDLDEYSRAGRVPDGTMMLNIAVRAAVDRCINLQSFKWDLNIRLLHTVYAGIAMLKDLQSFYLRCPSNRTPQPISEIPALPNLREFIMANFDPLNYPDDVSNLLFHATKLEAVSMYFSPRMRNAGEASVSFVNFFRHNIAAKRKLRVKRIGIYNVLAQRTPETLEAFDVSVLEEFTSINSFGGGLSGVGANQQLATYWVDKTWDLPIGHPIVSNLRVVRGDRVSKDTAKNISRSPLVEKAYFINASHRTATDGASSDRSTLRSDESTPTPGSTPQDASSSSNSARSAQASSDTIRDSLIDTLCTVHGDRLKHLILPARLPLATHSIAQLIRGCPNLTQLSVALEEIDPVLIRTIFPFGQKLLAVRLTCPDQPGPVGLERRQLFEMFEARDDHIHFLELELAARFGGHVNNFNQIKYFAIGDKIFESGSLVEEMVMIEDEDGNEVVEKVLKRRVKQLEVRDVMHVEIWKMDTLDII